MTHTCQHCDHEANPAHAVTVYAEDGTEDRMEVLCDSCYDEWLQSWKG